MIVIGIVIMFVVILGALVDIIDGVIRVIKFIYRSIKNVLNRLAKWLAIKPIENKSGNVQ